METFLDQLRWALISIASIIAIFAIGIVLTRLDHRTQSEADEKRVRPDANDAKGE